MANRGYKYQIQQKLEQLDWEILTIDSSSAWWDHEHWKIESKYHPKTCFYLFFIVNPMFEQTGYEKPQVCEIVASTKFLENWNDESNKIASIGMLKQNFENKLEEFLTDLKNYRR